MIETHPDRIDALLCKAGVVETVEKHRLIAEASHLGRVRWLSVVGSNGSTMLVVGKTKEGPEVLVSKSKNVDLIIDIIFESFHNIVEQFDEREK